MRVEARSVRHSAVAPLAMSFAMATPEFSVPSECPVDPLGMPSLLTLSACSSLNSGVPRSDVPRYGLSPDRVALLSVNAHESRLREAIAARMRRAAVNCKVSAALAASKADESVTGTVGDFTWRKDPEGFTVSTTDAPHFMTFAVPNSNPTGDVHLRAEYRAYDDLNEESIEQISFSDRTVFNYCWLQGSWYRRTDDNVASFTVTDAYPAKDRWTLHPKAQIAVTTSRPAPKRFRSVEFEIGGVITVSERTESCTFLMKADPSTKAVDVEFGLFTGYFTTVSLYTRQLNDEEWSVFVREVTMPRVSQRELFDILPVLEPAM